MIDPTSAPARYHFAAPIRCAATCGCIHCYADRICAATERWFCVAMLILAGVLFAGLAYHGFGRWWMLAGVLCLGWAGAVARYFPRGRS